MGIHQTIDDKIKLTPRGVVAIASRGDIATLEDFTDCEIRAEYIERHMGKHPIFMPQDQDFIKEPAKIAIDAVRRGDTIEAERALECIISPSTASLRGAY